MRTKVDITGKVFKLDLSSKQTLEGLTGIEYTPFDNSKFGAVIGYFGADRGGLKPGHVQSLLTKHPKAKLVLPGELEAAKKTSAKDLKVYLTTKTNQLEGIIACLPTLSEEFLKRVIIIPTHQLINGEKKGISEEEAIQHINEKILFRLEKNLTFIVPYSNCIIYNAIPEDYGFVRAYRYKEVSYYLPAFGTHAETLKGGKPPLIYLHQVVNVVEKLDKPWNLQSKDPEKLKEFLTKWHCRVDNIQCLDRGLTIEVGDETKCWGFSDKQVAELVKQAQKTSCYENYMKFYLFKTAVEKTLPPELINEVGKSYIN